MCGIAGILFFENSIHHNFDKKSIVEEMASCIKHRGPDSNGFYFDDHIGLGHVRLSIIDLTTSANQPMISNENGSIIIFNGEIYNFQLLRRELEENGVNIWYSNSDTEVILNLYIKWGLEGLKKLEGVFSICIWDYKQTQLILFRDRLGVKPLFYNLTDSYIAFSSELSSLRKINKFDDSINDQSLVEYLWFGNTHGERTFYNGSKSLEPGHYLTVKNSKIKIESWWKIEDYLIEPDSNISFEEGSCQLLNTLDNAVSRQMVSDVPLAFFLSGGLDSSSILASATRSGNKHINSFSASFDFDKGISEFKKANKVAIHLGLNHKDILVDSTKIQDIILLLSDVHGEPFADAANIPLYLMCKSLPEDIKVVLQGDGGDELFAGYRRYSMLNYIKYWEKIPKVLVNSFHRFGLYGRRLSRLAYSLGNPNPAIRMGLLLTRETLNNPPDLIFDDDRKAYLSENTDPFLEYRKAADRFKAYNSIQQMLLTDMTVQLPNQFLPKVDRASMAAGIEARVPLLDEGLLKLVLNMPTDWKVKGSNKKIILRKSQSARLPKDILNAPKMGFGVPTDTWLATTLFDFCREYILDTGFEKKFFFNRDILEKLLSRHKSGDYSNGFLLWKILQLSISFQRK